MQNFKNKLLKIFIIAIFCIPFTNIYAEDIIPDPEITPDPITTPDPIPDPDPAVDPNTINQTPPPPVLQENFIIRINDVVLFNGPVDLPASGTVSILDSNNVAHDVNSQSVLAVLKSIDNNNDSFAISNLAYYDSFGSFYLKCITPTSGTEYCDNWQYAVGATTPYSSIDTTILAGGETVGIYFGSSHRVVFDKNNINTNESLQATAQNYDYQNDTWNPLTNVNIGVTLPNPNDPWNPNIVATYPVDTQGIATIPITQANTYTIGIVEDYYFPSYTIVVSDTPVNTNSGGNSSITQKSFSVSSAISYIESHQDNDGSFAGSSMYTDWASIALASDNISSSVKNKIIDYMKGKNKISSNPTDNMRRSMALLALNQNPYDFDGTNYIEAIIKSFDGAQFGDSSLVNDDIFAVIVLGEVGYTQNDNEIQKAIEFIIKNQKSNGSWEDSVDITSASIQALSNFKSLSGVNSSISLANTYIQNTQQSDGGFGNIPSTAWAMQAESAIGASWNISGKKGIDYLAINQQPDGGVLDIAESLQNRVWGTSYAIPGALGKTWASIMQNVDKQEIKKSEDKKVEITENSKIVEPEKNEVIEKVAKESPKLINEKEIVKKVATEKIKGVEERVAPTPSPLVANAIQTKNTIPKPYIFGGMVLLTGLLLLKNFYKKV